MDLSINRLKIIGEEEIQRLDLKIAEYKSKDEKTILDKSINDIKTQISDFSSICNDIQTEIKLKTSKITDLSKKLKTYETKYTSLTEETTKLETSIFEIEEKKKDYESQFIIMEQNILSLKENEKKLRENLTQLNSSLEKRKKDYKTEKETIDAEIKMLELRMSSLMQNSLTSHSEFVSQLQSIELNPSIDENQVIFDNIKLNLVKTICKTYSFTDNSLKYIKLVDRINYFIYHIEGSKINIRKINYCNCHQQQIPNCEACKILKTISICINSYSSNSCFHCETCKFPKHPNHNSQFQHKSPEEQKKIKETYLINFLEWIENNYSQILEKSIKNKELLKLSKELNYKKFYELFDNSQLFNMVNINSYEFIVMIVSMDYNS
jgi:hypothetical protein